MMSVYSEYQCVCVILHMSVNTQYGWSALMVAARGGKTEIVVELVKAGANVDIQTKVCQYNTCTLCIYMYMYMYIVTILVFLQCNVSCICMCP